MTTDSQQSFGFRGDIFISGWFIVAFVALLIVIGLISRLGRKRKPPVRKN